MHHIKSTELTASERYFVDNALTLIENTFSTFVDNHVDVENIDHYFASALQPIIDARQLVVDANANGGDLLDGQGNSIDVDFKLETAELEYKNFILEIKRALGVVNEMQALLNATRSMVEGKKSEYSAQMDELKTRLESSVEKLSWCIADSAKDDEK